LTFILAQVRHVRDNSGIAGNQSPFVVEGGHNVFLETVKRGEDDDFLRADAASSMVLRLYEAYGGHAKVRLRISGHLRVSKAILTNLLEDEVDELNLLSTDNEEDATTFIRLNFRGFEVKTLKLWTGAPDVGLYVI
jgi:alpha-mannosidase